MEKHFIKPNLYCFLCLLIIPSLLIGCASPKPVIQGYAGQHLQEEEIAFVFPSLLMEIISLDSKATTNYGRYRSFEVTPGFHKITVRINFYSNRKSTYSKDVQTIEFKAKPGKIYTTECSIKNGKWAAWIIDITNEEKGKRFRESIKMNENGQREANAII